jgi:FixJ family two-component response regulator
VFIVVIDSDDNYKKQTQQHLQEMEVETTAFNHYSEFLQSNLTSTPYLDFILFGISPSDKTNFQHALDFKESNPNHATITIIFLLSTHDDSDYVKSLKYGDGYLLKPYSGELLMYTINHHSNHSKLTRTLAVKNNQLSEYKNLVKREHNIVENIFKNQYESHLVQSKDINYYISPASIFNGDVLLTAKGPSGSLYLGVGDVTGHGLPAAIGAMPVYSTFRSMATKGINIGSIAAEMNGALRKLLPDYMMMAFAIAELDFAKGRLYLWAGGMPDVVIVAKEGGIKHTLQSKHAPLSVLEPEKFRKNVDMIELVEGDRVYFYTDGIEEATSSKGEMFGIDRLESIFNTNPQDIFNNIINDKSEFIKDTEQDDDITLVEIQYHDQKELITLFSAEERFSVPSIPWNFTFRLGPKELQKTDPIAQIIRFIDASIDISSNQDCISTILSELITNAIDHGVLGLDSKIKDGESGFADYYIARKNAMETLTEGEVIVRAKYHVINKGKTGQLSLSVTDSGNGFDFNKIINNNDYQFASHGRGIQLVKHLAERLEFLDGGKTILVHCLIERQTQKLLT